MSKCEYCESCGGDHNQDECYQARLENAIAWWCMDAHMTMSRHSRKVRLWHENYRPDRLIGEYPTVIAALFAAYAINEKETEKRRKKRGS